MVGLRQWWHFTSCWTFPLSDWIFCPSSHQIGIQGEMGLSSTPLQSFWDESVIQWPFAAVQLKLISIKSLVFGPLISSTCQRCIWERTDTCSWCTISSSIISASSQSLACRLAAWAVWLACYVGSFWSLLISTAVCAHIARVLCVLHSKLSPGHWQTRIGVHYTWHWYHQSIKMP